MRVRAGGLAVSRTGSAGPDNLNVVFELRAQTDRLRVMVILTVARLVAQAGVKRLGLAIEGIAYPDAVATAARRRPPARRRSRLG